MSNYLERLFVLGAVFALGILAIAFPIVNAQPTGADPTELGTGRFPAAAAGSHEALAGNVTTLNLAGESITRTWQGYHGNVTGNIVLGDADGNKLYNWAEVNPRGQVFASTNETVQWAYAQCFNYTAAGTFASDTANAGGTSQFGLNLTQLHAMFNVQAIDADSVDRTFNTTGSGGHPLFYLGSLEFTEGQCNSAWLFVDGEYQASDFSNALLYEPETASVIFTAIIEYETSQGFDGQNYDYQMLVIEDGHGTNTATTTYYFSVEIQ
jgi:hypothetical protein